MTAKPNSQRGWPVFNTESERDEYYNRCISNGIRVRKVCRVVAKGQGIRFTVADIDGRRGPAAVD